jgi:hypothetical protein
LLVHIDALGQYPNLMQRNQLPIFVLFLCAHSHIAKNSDSITFFATYKISFLNLLSLGTTFLPLNLTAAFRSPWHARR